jgi:hypothetical protein
MNIQIVLKQHRITAAIGAAPEILQHVSAEEE